MQTLPAVDFTSPTAAKSSDPELFWQRQPRAVGRSELLSHEVYYSLKLCIGEFATHNSSAAIDSTQNEPIASQFDKCSTASRERAHASNSGHSGAEFVGAMDSVSSSEPLTPRSTGAPAMIERRSSFVLEGASTKLVDDLAKAAAAARADAILGRAEYVRRSSSIGEETEVAAAA